MPTITRSKKFEKEYAKLPAFICMKFKDRMNLFLTDPNAPILNRHRLKGEYEGCQSINITGDYRAIFRWMDDQHIRFQRIGTHSQLYK